jgi:putative membrane protein
VEELRDGAQELADGMAEFQEEGIDKLCDLYWDNIPLLVERLQALQKLGQDYSSYSGLATGTEGSVKFLFRSEAIKNED